MAVLRISNVDIVPQSPEIVAGFQIDFPSEGSSAAAYSLTLKGWLVPRPAQVQQMRLIAPDRPPQVIPLDAHRPDVAAVHPDISWAGSSGFHASVGVAQLPREFQLRLIADIAGQPPLPLAVIKGTRKQFPSAHDETFQPIMLTTLFRTGGSWAIRLLSRHKAILALQPFDYEPRIAAYWMNVFAALAEPKSYLRTLGAELVGPHWWLGESNIAPKVVGVTQPAFVNWLGSDNVDDLLSFFQGRIQKAYEQVEIAEGRTGSEFFIERHAPDALVQEVLWEIYPRAREIVLLRDFRDMVASVLAYNRKRGYEFFGRHASASDEEYVRSLRGSVEYLLKISRTRSDRNYLLKYEDLVLRPRETLPPLLEYLGLEAQPEVVDEMLQKAVSHTLQQELHPTSRSPEESIGRWERDLDAGLKATCEEAFGDLLVAAGY